MESFEEKLKRVLAEEIELSEYDPEWPVMFRNESEHLVSCLPGDMIQRIEHFGSTAVPGLVAKPIIDIMVGTPDLEEARSTIAPLLESRGYDYFWRPSFGDDGPPFYPWFIKRDNESGIRTHHIHMVKPEFNDHWDRLLFRDYLLEHTSVAEEYGILKRRLAKTFSRDRVAYTQAKTAFIVRVTKLAKQHYG